jgi:hypothetical protein
MSGCSAANADGKDLLCTLLKWPQTELYIFQIS